MRVPEFIRHKRDGGAHASGQLREFIAGMVAGAIPDYQVSAWLMAAYLRGLDDAELAELTDAMMRSGEVYDLADVPGLKVDKHSTGGVGDKVSLILGPLAAACGLVVPMIAGRGLGHTGGTLDKLEAIPGFSTQLSKARFKALLRKVGVAVGGQTAKFVPADRKLYALRDVTATVESIPLIAASIMSKKLAEGSEALVLDVKTGGGAFMAAPADARALARTMVRIGRAMGRKVSAMITNMDEPLGWAVGNANEVAESIACLRGEGPPDLMEVTLALTARMLTLSGLDKNEAGAASRMREALASGRALEKLRRMVEAQGGDPRVVDDPKRLPQPPRRTTIEAGSSGWLAAFDCRQVGLAACALGAGRAAAEDRIDPAVGLLVLAKVGDKIEKGQPIFEIAWRDRRRLAQAQELLARSFTLAETRPRRRPMIIERDVKI